MSKVTVIIPTYNQAQYLQKCIESVLNQTRKPDQLIIVDDSSIDNTPKIVGSFGKQVEYIRHKQNLGAVKTFNDGLVKSKGDYILMVSGDDWLEKSILEKETGILNQNPNVGLVYSQATTVFDDGKRDVRKLIIASPAGEKSYLSRNNDFEILLSKGNFIPYMTALVRNNIYKKIGLFNQNLPFLHDYEMWIRIAQKTNLSYVAKPLAFYRVHGNNLHLNKASLKEYPKEINFIFEKYVENNKSLNLKIKKKILYSNLIDLTNNQIALNRYYKAFSYWKRAIKYNPYSIPKWHSWQPIYFMIKSFIGR